MGIQRAVRESERVAAKEPPPIADPRGVRERLPFAQARRYSSPWLT